MIQRSSTLHPAKRTIAQFNGYGSGSEAVVEELRRADKERRMILGILKGQQIVDTSKTREDE